MKLQGNEIDPWELIRAISLLFIIMSSTNSSSSSDPLFSFVATLYALNLLYFPSRLYFSPVVLIAAIALLCLLRLGALQKTESRQKTETHIEVGKSESLIEKRVPGPDPDYFRGESFVQWNVGAPLEVIYEEGEDAGDGDDRDRNPKGGNGGSNLERYPSLSMYYPESDSDSSSDGDFSGGRFRWEEEDREEMLIEIALDHRHNGTNNGKADKKEFDLSYEFGYHGEEENMIEIDISPAKLDDVFAGGEV